MALKSKVHVAQNWPNLEKRPPFLQFSSKLSEFFFGERSDKLGSFFYKIKADIKQLSPKVLMKIEGIQAISVPDGLNHSTTGYFRVKILRQVFINAKY